MEGRKTATRRIAKGAHFVGDQDGYRYLQIENKGVWFKGDPNNVAPYKVGDILYVRETVWQKCGSSLDVNGETETVWRNEFKYVATDEEPKVGWDYSWGKRPSIHMPKAAARIFLRVTNVRVERLQQMEHEDVLKEGLKASYDGWVSEWKNLWDSTIKKFDWYKYGFDANPWVWVIEFEIIEKEIENNV